MALDKLSCYKAELAFPKLDRKITRDMNRHKSIEFDAVIKQTLDANRGEQKRSPLILTKGSIEWHAQLPQ